MKHAITWELILFDSSFKKQNLLFHLFLLWVSNLDELDTQTIYNDLLKRIFDISIKKKCIRCHNYLDIGLLNYKNKI
jgi:hypothetical protein